VKGEIAGGADYERTGVQKSGVGADGSFLFLFFVRESAAAQRENE
jgi:hypothetical protein